MSICCSKPGRPRWSTRAADLATRTGSCSRGWRQIRSEFGESISLADIGRIVITHGHIDHFGGLAFLHAKSPQAEIAIHELDVRILTGFEERVAVAKKAMRQFLERPASAATCSRVSSICTATRRRTRTACRWRARWSTTSNSTGCGSSTRRDTALARCASQWDDVLLSADHILPEISPHQAPESIMPYTGLGHYLESLDKVAPHRRVRSGVGGSSGADSRRLQTGRRDSQRARAQAGKDSHDHSRVARAAHDQPNLGASCIPTCRAFTCCWPWRKWRPTWSICISTASYRSPISTSTSARRTPPSATSWRSAWRSR